MTDTKGIVTLKEIVSNILNDLGDTSDRGQYFRYLQFAIRIATELHVHDLNVYRSVKLTMSDINTVDLPEDCLRVITVGTPYNGALWPMTEKNDILSRDEEECGEGVYDTEDGEDVVSGSHRDVAAYGLPGGLNEYYYRVDMRGRRIIIDGPARSEVRLWYVSSGIRLDGTSYIPRIAMEAVIAGVHDLRLRHDINATENDKNRADVRYTREVEKLRFIQGPSLDELYDAIYSTIRQTAKR